MAGCIPVFYEVEACKAANYRYYHDWQELTAQQQAFLIAHYVAKKNVDNHQQDAQDTYMKQQQKRRK